MISSPKAYVSFLLLGLVMLTGCATLILRESDDRADTIDKVAARLVLCPITLCLSELSLAEHKQDEARRERQAHYWRWVRSLPPEEQAREYRLEEARIQGAGQALLGLGIGGGLFRTTPAPLLAPSVTPLPQRPFGQAPQSVPPVSCLIRQVGAVVHTDCY